MRTTLVFVPAILFAALLAGCTSPGKSFDFVDLTFSGAPSVTSTATPPVALPAPSTTSPAIITFVLFNTAHEALTNIAFRVFRDDPATAPIASGTVASVAGQSHAPVAVTIDPNTDSGALGLHTYFMVIDPDNLIREMDETNNTASVAVAFADLDLVLAAPTVAPAVVTTATAIQMTVTVTNVDTSLKGLTASGVVVQVLDTSVTPAVVVASGTMPDIAATLSASLVLTVPATTVGTHVYSVVIDPQNVVVEGTKANNQATVPVTVQPVAPG
ncbi:MAG: hypothetical protein H0X38_04725 [Planctomycetes bacterium]|nr:hypothetical protein [Planctomycetota bacterium]